MKKINFTFLFAILLCFFSIKSFSQQDERIKASYMIAFGRIPMPSELNYWLGRGYLSIFQLIELHRQGFTEYPTNLQRETIINSYIDALGRNPSEDEIKYWMNGDNIYIQLMSNHMQLLKYDNWENQKVIQLSYATVFHRVPTNAEINFWLKRGVTPFFLLVGYHEYYKGKNKSEIGSSGTVNLQNLASVSTISLSPAIALEASKYISHNGSAIISHIISQHGGNIIVAGR
jgi:hypothetical protein